MSVNNSVWRERSGRRYFKHRGSDKSGHRVLQFVAGVLGVCQHLLDGGFFGGSQWAFHAWKFTTQVVAICLFIAAPIQAATYRVSKTGNDGNPCSLQKRTIPAGLKCLTQPGDTLLIHQGTYTERLFEIDFGASGRDWQALMTVQAAPGETVIIQVQPGGDNALRFQDGSIHHVEIADLIFDGTGGRDDMTLTYLAPGSHHIRFRNVTLRNSQGNGMLGYGADHEFINMTVHHNGMFAGYPISIGMYMATDRSLIQGGKFYDNECYGIRFWDSDTSQDATGNVIDGAEIFGNGIGIAFNGQSVCGAGGGGITLADSGNTVKNCLIYGNYYGIEFFHYQPILDAVITGNTIRDNAIIGLFIPVEARRTIYTDNRVYRNGVGNIDDKGVGSLYSGNSTSPVSVGPPAVPSIVRVQ